MSGQTTAARPTPEAPCDLSNLERWFLDEAEQVSGSATGQICAALYAHIDELVRWPSRAVLLWDGCARTSEHPAYPAALVGRLRTVGLRPNTLSNGPAVMSFQASGGARPRRFGTPKEWDIHHLYFGFPYVGRTTTLNAVREGKHFTQSAGLLAVHPVVHAMCDEYPFFAWWMRALAYLRFGYDPDAVLSDSAHDPYGFTAGHGCEVWYADDTQGG